MAKSCFSLKQVSHTPGKSDLPTHVAGTAKGEEWVIKHGREPGRDDERAHRTARDSTSLNAADRDPIDPRMPFLPPA
jgi:hypothetical protein